MYEVHDEINTADDILWQYIKTQLAQQTQKPVPEKLFRDLYGNFSMHWHEPNLFLSQTCGYPFIVDLAERGIKIIATPVYEINRDLPAGWYRSVIIVHKDFQIAEGAIHKEKLRLLQGLRAGYNDENSNSGMNLLRAALLEVFSDAELQQGPFASLQMTGAHKNSVTQVASGEIDVAAIDNVTYHLLGRYYPDLVGNTKVLTTTGISPGLPLITAANTADADVSRIREILIGQLP
jgi:ABC-type phosphate/phosphonate transport system substrate-binding protein